MSTLVAPETPPTGFDSLNAQNNGGTKDLGLGTQTHTFTFNLGTTIGGSPYVDNGPYFVDDQGFGGADPVFIDQNAGTFSYTISLSDWVSAGSPAMVRLWFNDSTPTGSLNGFFDLTLTCFAAGTAIATPKGEVTVESLAIGDRILTAAGRDVAVKWVGRQTVSTIFAGSTDRVRLVRISAGALGNGLPRRELRVTADHALLIEGLLVNAGALVNGTTITFEPLAMLEAEYVIYHIETEDHDVILAEGTPVETFIDYVARRAFDNYSEYLELYGEDRTVPEMVYPRISSARMLPQDLKRRLGLTAAA